MLRDFGVVVAAAAMVLVTAACSLRIGGGGDLECGTFESEQCFDLVEVAFDAIPARGEIQPRAVGVGLACSPNARCVPSALGGPEAAVLIRWPNGTVDWVMIALPADWPSSPPSEAVLMADDPPAHLLPLVGGG